MARRRRKRKLLALLAALLFLLLFQLNPYLAGVLPGGGRWRDKPKPAVQRGMLEILVVRRDTRQPVKGATIHLAGLHGTTQTRRTNGEGRADFGGLATEPLQVRAEGEAGFATAWSKPGHRIRMELAARTRRTGRVHDSDGKAVPATVHLLDRDARILASAQTGADGRYVLDDSPKAASVCAWPADGVPGAAASGDILIGKGERIRGEAMEAGHEFVEIYAQVPDTTADRMVPLRARWVVDSDGNYEGLLPSGAQGWIYWGTYAVPVGESHSVAFMQLARGTVIDEQSRPLADVRILARALSRGMPVSPNPFGFEKRTDSQGAYDLGWGPHTRYELELSGVGRARMVVPAPRDETPIVLPKGFGFGGRVIDEQDRPVPLARVIALPTPDPGARFIGARGVTTDDGRFYLDGVAGSYARVQVHKDGYKPATMEKVAPNGFATIRLRR